MHSSGRSRPKKRFTIQADPALTARECYFDDTLTIAGAHPNSSHFTMNISHSDVPAIWARFVELVRKERLRRDLPASAASRPPQNASPTMQIADGLAISAFSNGAPAWRAAPRHKAKGRRTYFKACPPKILIRCLRTPSSRCRSTSQITTRKPAGNATTSNNKKNFYTKL